MISDDPESTLSSFAWQSSADNCTSSSSNSEMSPKATKANGKNYPSEGTQKKAKKRKFDEEPSDYADNILDHVKKEDDSQSRKKKKTSKDKVKQEPGENDTAAADDLSYLELRVKQEKQESASKRARRHTHTDSYTDTNQHYEVPHKSKKKKHQISVSEQSLSEHETEVCNKQERDSSRKKKQKIEMNIIKHENMIIEENFSADETIIQSTVRNDNHKKNKKVKKSKEHIDETSNAEEHDVANTEQSKQSSKDNHIESNCGNVEISENIHKVKKHMKQNKKLKKDKFSEESVAEDQCSIEENVVETPIRNKQRKNTASTSSNTIQYDKSLSKDRQHKEISNHNHRVSFPVEVEATKSDSDSGAMSEVPARNGDVQRSSDSDNEPPNNEAQALSSLNFTAPAELGLKRRSRLSDRILYEEEAAADAAGFDSDDEVWLVRCPREVSATALAGRALPLQGRSKLKLGEDKYDADAEPAGAVAAALCVWAGGGAARRVRVAGEVTLRRRLPRARPAVAAAAAAEAESRVPMPCTKLRHPLLGADYEESLAPPAAAAAALARSSKKKKKKKRKHSEADAETATDIAEAATKRRRGTGRGAARDTWDSERDIEENLFNF